MSYFARHTIIVSQDGDTYTATEQGVETKGRGASPPKAIADYATQFMDEEPQVVANE
jgi:hypothetical protein